AAALQGAPREFETSFARAQRLGLRRVSAAFTSGHSKSSNKLEGFTNTRSQANRAQLRSDLAQEMESGSYPPPHSKALFLASRQLPGI
ncbi:MAG: hypothetical protein SGI88_00005, partial [Candidatus Hydrogenedentes bacterium]|nr:hypothetical protein [Candidatus Hydrogenedentota bacterium]